MAHIKAIQKQAQENDYFRHVLATSEHVQIVIMSIPPGGDIGEETHADNDQTLYLVEGSGKVVLEGQANDFNKGDLVLVPAGTRHNFIAADNSAMKIITTYSPPHHPEGTIQKTKTGQSS